MHFAQGSAAVHWCCVTAQLYEEQILTGVLAVAQARCQAALQSSTEQWGMHFALTSVAVNWCFVTADHISAALFRAKCISTVQSCCAKQDHSRQCVTAVTPMDISSSYRCAVTHHRCYAALFRAKCSFHRSVLLRKTGSQQIVCHCDYTYGDLLCIQVCSDPPQMLCSTVQGKMQFPPFSLAVQNRLTADSVSLRLHLWRFPLPTGVQ